MTAPTLKPLRRPLTALLTESLAPDFRGALCARPGEDPESWHPFPQSDFEHARRTCAQCPLSSDCLAFGLANGFPGVWGGQRLG